MSRGMRIGSLLGMLLIIGGLFADTAKIPLTPLRDTVAARNFSFTLPQEEPPEILLTGKILPNTIVKNFPILPVIPVVSPLIDTGTSLDTDIQELLLTDELDTKDLENGTFVFLQKVFEKTQDTQVMNAILQELIDTYQFLTAKQFIEKLTPRLLRDVDVHLSLQAAFNTFALADNNYPQTLQATVDEFYKMAKLTKEEYDRYSGLIALMQKEYATFLHKATSFKKADYTTFATTLQTLQAQIANQSDMPSYYLDALIAMELFNQGYFQPAKVLALSALQQNKDYILPYQILAYANFLTNSRDAAIDYLTTLATLEPALHEKYDFLIGVASYRNKQYAQSVLKLTQIQDTTYRLDKERYLALNYAALKQYSKLLSSQEKMLGYPEIQKSDFYSYFYQVLFVPYFKGEPPTLYKQNPSLTQNYLSRCYEVFTGKDSIICRYGKIGYQLISGTTDATGFENSLIKLAEQYPQGYLFHALGERYLLQNMPEKAKSYLIKAINMSTTSEEALQIKALLQRTV